MSQVKREIEVSTIGECCAGFTVEYALLVKDKYYVAYYNAEHCITVASRPRDKGAWQVSHPTGEWLADKNRFMHQTGYDSHNYLTLAMDNQGHLHLAGNMHKDKMVWFRSTRPYDIHSLVQGTMTGIREESATYPLFFNGRDGELLFRYRDGESGNGDDIYNRWSDSEQRWLRLLESPLLSGNGLRNAYARLPLFGPDNQWHMIWMWRDTPHCETCHDLSYARSPDMIHWFTQRGEPLTLPITLESGDVVDPAPVEQGLINMSQNIGFDSQGRVLITWHRYDADGFSQAWIAHARQGNWVIKLLSRWDFRWDFHGMGSIPPEVIISAPHIADGGLYVEFQQPDGTSGRWYLDEETLAVTQTEYGAITPLPAHFYQVVDDIAPQAQVQIIPELYQPQPAHFLRWEALPIQRDVPSDNPVPPGKLTLIRLHA
ncbi:BNR repeat-containing protein [Kosakonia sp.]|uniref:BNR repeat-containing protein n=1 Tax=Kosakonia sp. TaxID=1916651 RepID=UPI0028A0D83A|nr:BNR repeat-containing protein [Kosakonia sp.]